MDHVDTCVIGGGVVGLAIARKLAVHSGELFVLEQESAFGQGVSSRNSEVIHAGIYYAQGSLKSRLCLRGKELLYEYCAQRGVAHNRCGKLIVATEQSEEEILHGIDDTAKKNGVVDLQSWSASKIQKLEPAAKATAALFSPSTGIVSSHELMATYLADVSNENGQLVLQTRVVSVSKQADNFLINCEIEGEKYAFTTRVLVNAAGLGAQRIAEKCDFLSSEQIPPLYLCKGNYFVYAGKNPFSRLIYPVPEKTGAGLGVHATIDLGGQLKFGPDVEYLDSEDYSVNVSRKADYVEAVRRYFPGLQADMLSPGYVGIRPKLQGPGHPVRDFDIQTSESHGISGFVQLFGIESPGLTSSMAIGEYVENALLECY
ncbi:MAG: NAD(P)/FAD-dependent oxidoreductase [Pseudomonadales bacterium]|nr:NAD(P)/FAD-dependent oxidoreductase [Pseudomonadales bacterium]MDG1443526.1 NAD(P)/FAD-dependent oxidoreductase [Pseudomonadales bacterium]